VPPACRRDDQQRTDDDLAARHRRTDAQIALAVRKPALFEAAGLAADRRGHGFDSGPGARQREDGARRIAAHAGAADDLVKATNIARGMVTHYSLSEALGAMSYEDETTGFLGIDQGLPRPRAYNEHTVETIDAAVAQLIASALEYARQVRAAHRSALDRAAAALLAKETLQQDELRARYGAAAG
jgi:hypothetical protein